MPPYPAIAAGTMAAMFCALTDTTMVMFASWLSDHVDTSCVAQVRLFAFVGEVVVGEVVVGEVVVGEVDVGEVDVVVALDDAPAQTLDAAIIPTTTNPVTTRN